jgi:peptidoglycan/LPS O-acetylase OafA/YrhL
MGLGGLWVFGLLRAKPRAALSGAYPSEVERRQYPNFDWLRLFLALEVVVLHVHGVNTGWKEFLPLPIPPVPAFLAISGFLVLGSLERSQGYGHFWAKRAWRVLPAFFAVLILTWTLHGFDGMMLSLRSYYTFGSVNQNSPNSSLWSLAAEQVAYALMALLFALGFYKRPSLSLWIASLYTLGLLAFAFVFGSTGQLWATLPAAFFIGSFSYLADLRKVPSWVGWALLFGFGSSFWWQGSQEFEAMRLALSVPVASVATLLIGTGKPLPIRLPVDISYGIYIYHLPILIFLHKQGVRGLDLWVYGIASTLLVSLFSYYCLEKPALRMKARGLAPPKTAVPEAAG